MRSSPFRPRLVRAGATFPTGKDPWFLISGPPPAFGASPLRGRSDVGIIVARFDLEIPSLHKFSPSGGDAEGERGCADPPLIAPPVGELAQRA